MPASRRILFLPVAALLVIAACGGSTPTSSPELSGAASPAPSSGVDGGRPTVEPGAPEPGTTKNACELIAPSDVAAATGVDAAGISPGELKVSPTVLSPGHTECSYQGGFGRIIVALTPEDGANLYDAARGAYRDAVEIPGLGDGAFYSIDNDRSFVWQGPVTTMFTAFLNGDLELESVTRELGTRMLANL
jgi:hypothetical protein